MKIANCCNSFNNCFGKMAKVIIAICNIIIILVAIVAGVVAVVKFKDEDWFKLVKDSVPTNFVIAAMVFMLFTALLGLSILFTTALCVRMLYFIVILVVIGAEIACVVICYGYTDDLYNQIQHQWQLYKNRPIVSSLEVKMNCCGFHYIYWNKSTLPMCGPNYTNVTLYQDCFDVFNSTISSNISMISDAGIAMVVFELLLLSLACYITCCWKDENYQRVLDFI